MEQYSSVFVLAYLWNCLFTQFTLFYFFSVLHTILIRTNSGGNKLHLDTINSLVEANQLGLSSKDPTICNLSTFPCQQSGLQPRTLCGLIKPMCPILKLSCRVCQFYLSTKSCRKTCQTSGKYCSSSGCNSDPAPENTSSGDGE